jgi:hypothetical protein
MNKIKITAKYRLVLSEKLMELGNLIAVALVFGQFISGHDFAQGPFIAGVTLTLACYIISLVINF